MLTLEACGVVLGSKDGFKITEFGRSLCEKIGVIKIFFDGYSNLVSNQGSIIKNRIKNRRKLVKSKKVADAATFFSESTIDHLVIQEIANLQTNGTICDLGCGLARMLSKIYAELVPGPFGEEYRIFELPPDLRKPKPLDNALSQTPVQVMDIIRELQDRNLVLAAQLGTATERIRNLESQVKLLATARQPWWKRLFARRG